MGKRKRVQALLVEMGWSRTMPPAAPADNDYQDAEVFNAKLRGVSWEGLAVTVSRRGDKDAGEAQALVKHKRIRGSRSLTTKQIREAVVDSRLEQYCLERKRERDRRVGLVINSPEPKPGKRDTG